MKLTSIYPVFARNGLDVHGQGSVTIIIRWDRSVVKQINLNIKVYPEQWAPKERRVVAHTNARQLNHIIQKNIIDLENLQFDCINTGKVFDAKYVECYLAGDQANDIFNAFYERELEADKMLKHKTYTDQMQTLRALNKFNPSIRFCDLDYQVIKHFNDYLVGKKYGVNTIAKHHKNVKKYINLAIRYRIMSTDLSHYPYTGFKIKIKPSDRVNLSDDEIAAIEQIDYPAGSKLIAVRDIFLFACYTGLRFSDVMNLKKDNITFTKDGAELNMEMQKVSRQVRLPLHLLYDAKGEQVLMSYYSDDHEYIFPALTNAYVNSCLKEIAYDAGISKRLFFHIARHTFLTKVAQVTGSVFEVMKFGGIRKVDTAMIYVHLAEDLGYIKIKTVKW